MSEGHFINVKGFCVAELTDESKKTYDTVQVVSKTMKVKVSTESNTETLDGDGRPTDSCTTTGKTTIEVEINKLPLKIQAFLAGHGFDETTGAMLEKETDTPPDVACGYCFEKSNGKKQYHWYYKGKFEKPDDDVEQISDGKAKFSTPSLKGTFVYRSDGNKACKWDEEEGTVPANILSTVTEPPAALLNPAV